MTIRNCARLLINAIVAISLCGFVLSCGGGGDSDSGGAPGQTGTITITTDLTSIPADGSSSTLIHALIRDSSGNPVRHYTEVVFTTNLGHFRNGSTRYTMTTQPPLKDGLPDPDADPTGIAEVQFIAGTTAGSAKITVNSNGVTNSLYVTLKGGTGAIVLTASPETIPADGSSATKVTATITDDLGGPVISGTEVTFKTGLGYFENGSKTHTLKTIDETGIVDVSLIAGVVPGTTYIQAATGNVTQALSLVMTKIDPSYSEITVEANPSRIAADGKSQSVITATVTQIQNIANSEANISGQPISGVPITLYKITSNVVPEPLPDANLYTGKGTSIKGPFYSYGGLIEFTMTAIPEEDNNPYFIVWLFNPLSGERESLINLSDFSCEIWTDKWHCETRTETVSKSPLPGNYQMEVQTNCSFEIKVDGDIGPAQTGKTVLYFGRTDATGKAVYTYTADWLPGTFNIKAETGELSNSEQALSEETSLTQTSGDPVPIEIKIPSIDLYANGKSDMTVTALAWTAGGNKVPDGTDVYFSASIGSITPTAKTVDGVASAILRASTSSTSVVSKVTATVGTDSASTTVTFVGVSLSDMQATPPAIFANGTDTSKITLQLKDDSGVAISGETMTFTTTKGSLSSGVGVTNSEGVAATTLTAPNATGTATITATYGTITTTTTVTFMQSGGGVVSSIALTANPTSIPANGSSSSTVTATLTDSSGVAVPAGTSVTFTTDLGTFAGGGMSVTVPTPNASGVVSVSLISASTAGSATVIATSGGVSQSVNVTFSGSGVVATINLTANPNTLPANGTSTSVLRADVRDGSNNPVPDGTAISFVILTGTGTLSANTGTTVGGFVQITYTASTTAGIETVRAMSDNFVSANADITLTSAGVGTIALTANPTSIPADGSSSSVITATVKTADNQIIPDVEVVFTTSRGAITSPHTTDAAGKAVTLTSAQNNDPSVLVTATCQGVSGTVLVSFTGLSLTLSANPTSVLAGESSTITATFKDASGNPINGAILTFSTDKGTLNPATPQTTNASGQAAVIITSTTSGTATVTVTGGGATATTTVNFTRYLFTLEANPTTIRVAETSLITATLLDNGVPKAGETVSFSSSLGTLSSYTGVTLATGKVTTTLTAGTQSGIAVIDGTVTIATDTPPTDLAANTQVVITGGAAAKVIFAADPNVIATDSGVATLTATVYDATDQPVPNQNVYFRVNKSPGGGEYLSTSVKITNSFGVATVELYAGSLPSTYQGVEIEANTQADFGGSLGLTTLTIAGPVANIGIGMDLHTLTPEGGDLTVDITAIATDVNGNPVSDGTLVSFSVQAVEFDEDRANDQTINCWNGDGTACDCPSPPGPGPVVTTCTGNFGTAVTGWFSDDVNQDGEMYGCTGVAPSCPNGPMSTTEDVNHNGILDPGEDKNENGTIDPIQGTVINGSVATTGGLARAKLVYPQPQANNIRVKITAEAGGISNFYETILLCTEDMVDSGTCGIGY